MTLHDCGWMRDSWQCRGSHLKPEDKVPPSIRVTENPRVTGMTFVEELVAAGGEFDILPPVLIARRGRPKKPDALTPAEKQRAYRARKAK